jgi:hypothetical protein
MRFDDVPFPDGPAARAALEVATAYLSPALLNHCLRSYVWAAAQGTDRGIGYDEELLYVAAMLHDLALVPEFDNYGLPFENAGGHVAWVFGAGAGWPVERRRRAAASIVQHMGDEVDPAEHPEGHLLRLATGLDIAGRAAENWSAAFRAEVVGRIPRLSLDEEFVRAFEEQARRKPSGSAAGAVNSGLADRMSANVLHADGRARGR